MDYFFLVNFANFYLEQGNESMYQHLLGEAYDIRMKVFGPNHPDTITIQEMRTEKKVVYTLPSIVHRKCF